MTKLKYYRLSLMAPIAVPLVAIGLGMLSFEKFDTIAVLIGGSLLFAGPAYIVFVIGVLVWARGSGERPLRRLLRLRPIAPLVFAPLAALNSLVYYFLSRPHSARMGFALSESLQLAAIAIVFGYCYVAVVYVIGRLVTRSEATIVSAV